MQDPLLGKSLGRYQVISPIGKGGMGTVYQGYDPKLKRDVAIKVMHSDIAQDGHARRRFLQEAQVIANLNHAGIVKVYDFGQTDEHLYIIMEYIPHNNLQEILKSWRAQSQWLPLSDVSNSRCGN